MVFAIYFFANFTIERCIKKKIKFATNTLIVLFIRDLINASGMLNNILIISSSGSLWMLTLIQVVICLIPDLLIAVCETYSVTKGVLTNQVSIHYRKYTSADSLLAWFSFIVESYLF